jgi:hypothetical protein
VSSFARLVDPYPAPVQALVTDLAALVKTVGPGIREAVRPEMRCLRYSHARCGYFCGLYPQASGVQILFEFGVLLPDPEGLMEGNGPHVRFATIWADEPLRTGALHRLLTAAFDLPRRRADKLALVEAQAQQRSRDELLERAVLHGTLEDVGQALAAGASPNGQPYEIAPLFRTCIHRAEDHARIEIAQLLLAAGADPNCEYNGRVLLAHATRLGRAEIVRLLLDYGASPDSVAAVAPMEAPQPDMRAGALSGHNLGQWAQGA